MYAESGACSDAVASAAHGGVPACVSAARHLGLWVLDECLTVHVWLRRGGHRYAHAGCECVEHWDGGEATDGFGLPDVPRMLRQILWCLGVEHFVVTLESAIQQRKISRTGLAWLRTHTNDLARDAIEFARGDAESGLETLVRWRMRRHGLRIRSQIAIVGVGRVDFLIGDRLIIEVDGRANHDDASHRHKDLVRDANAAAWGYTTLRFDYALVVRDWELVESAILAQVEAGRHVHPAR